MTVCVRDLFDPTTGAQVLRLGMSHDQWMMRVRLVKAVLDMIDSFYRLLVVGGTLSVPIKPKVYQFVLSMKNM